MKAIRTFTRLAVVACALLLLGAHSLPQRSVPAVPRLPLGSPMKHIPAWDKLNPACLATKAQDIKRCMQSFVDYGSILGVVTLVDRQNRMQLDAVGTFKPDTIFQVMSISKP